MGQETKKTTKKGTELSQAKEALQQKDVELETAKSAIEKAEKARDIFLANMSHELRTPINTILGLNELILRESQEEAVKEYARDIRQAGNILLALVSDILDFSKLEADKLELTEGIYDVSSLLNDLINSISVQQRRKKLDLVLEIAQDIPYKLLGDEIHIRQIIGNLLSNAVRYTEKGRITLHLSWKEMTKDEIEIYVIVKDTGIGIKEEDIPKLFKAFQRMDSTVRSKDDRTGLGLAITQRLIEMMGGKLEVQSVYGKGSAFSFRIIQKVVDRKPLGDFEKQYRESLRSIEDYHEKFIAPMDGVETLHAIRALEGNPSRDIPVIALTANAVAGARELYLREGFQDYLTKPIDADKLENMLIEYLPSNVVYLTNNRKISDEYEQPEEGSELAIRESQLYLMGFNPRNGLRYMGGDKALYGKVLHDFHSILQEKEEALKDFLQKGDMPGYTIIVHSLKGNARNVGADDLADEAFELEKMAKAGQLEDVTVRSPILFSMMNSMRESLKVYLESEEAEEKQPEKEENDTGLKIAEEEWVRKLKELAARLDDFDGDSAAARLCELKRYERPETDKKMLRLCEKAVKDYAYDIALEIVNAVL